MASELTPAAGDAEPAGGDATTTRPSPAGLTAQDRPSLAILGTLVVASVALRLLTWDAVADGDHGRYTRTVLVGGAATVAVWLLMRLQTGARSLVPILAAALVLFAGDAVHYARRLHPIARGGPILSLEASFADEATVRRQWAIELSGGGRVRFDPGAAVLESPPSGPAYVSGRLAPVPDARLNWWLPVGLLERDRRERLTWRATITRTHDFYVVAELRQLLIQVVSYGLHITYPDERNVRRGHEIPHPVGSDGQPHEWVLERDGREIRLLIDGRSIWSAPQREALEQIKLGETKVDPQHGGSMRLERATYHNYLT